MARDVDRRSAEVTQAGPSTGTFVGSVTNTGAEIRLSETRNGITHAVHRIRWNESR